MSLEGVKLAGFTRRLANAGTTEFRSTDQSNLNSLRYDINNIQYTLDGFSKLNTSHTNTLENHEYAIESLQKSVNYLTNITFGLPTTLTLDQLNFNLTPASTTMAQGRLLWDSEYSTLLLGLNANINLALGQAMYKKIRNNTGITIIKGQVVYVTGSHGASNITVGLADASSEATAATTMGIAAENIDINSEGFIITQGYLKGINTNSLAGAEGSMLWLSETAGEITTTRPTQPAHGVHVGWLVKKAGGGAGSIYVHITNGQELYELHDVLISSPQDGQVLTYDNISGLWKNENPTGGAGTTEDIISCYVEASPDIASTGFKASRIIAYNCEIDEWYVIAGSSGTMQWDIKKSSFASYPSTSSIVYGTDYPKITAQSKNSNTAVSSWTSLNAGDVIEFYITSNTDVTSVGVFLKIRRV